MLIPGWMLPNAALETISLVAEDHAIRRDLFQPEIRRQGSAFPQHPGIDADEAFAGVARIGMELNRHGRNLLLNRERQFGHGHRSLFLCRAGGLFRQGC